MKHLVFANGALGKKRAFNVMQVYWHGSAAP
jgi:hypothetical protein